MANESRCFFPQDTLPAWMGDGTAVVWHAPGQSVFQQGDPADAIFYIRKGKIKLSVVSERGKESVVALLEPPQFFGEGALVGQSHRVSTALCLSETTVCRITKTSALQKIGQEPAFREQFLAHLLRRSIRVEADLIDQLFNCSELRLARLLLLLAKYDGDGPPEPVITNISQEMLAQMIGTTRARVSFFMNRFRAAGYITYKDRIEVHPTLQDIVRRHTLMGRDS